MIMFDLDGWHPVLPTEKDPHPACGVLQRAVWDMPTRRGRHPEDLPSRKALLNKHLERPVQLSDEIGIAVALLQGSFAGKPPGEEAERRSL